MSIGKKVFGLTLPLLLVLAPLLAAAYYAIFIDAPAGVGWLDYMTKGELRPYYACALALAALPAAFGFYLVLREPLKRG